MTLVFTTPLCRRLWPPAPIPISYLGRENSGAPEPIGQVRLGAGRDTELQRAVRARGYVFWRRLTIIQRARPYRGARRQRPAKLVPAVSRMGRKRDVRRSCAPGSVCSRPSWSCRQLLRVVVAIRRKRTRAFTCDPNNSVLFSRRKKRSERGMLNAAIPPIRNQNPRFARLCRAPPDPRWPGGARVAVSIVVNFEEGAEFSVTDGDPENEAVYEIEQRLAGRPDPAIDSHFEYGSRAAWWRIMEVLGQFGAPATVSSSGRAVERLPLLAQDAVRRGHEVSAHGWRWEGHADLDEAEERDRIARTVAAITAVTGIGPIAWHTRSPGSVNTRRLLVEEGGFLYDSDAYNDDLPYFVVVSDKRHLVLPYAFDTNDMQFFHTNRFSGAADFAAYVIDAFDWLHREGASAPKMMSIGLHLRMIGRPGRISALDRILRHIADRGDAGLRGGSTSPTTG